MIVQAYSAIYGGYDHPKDVWDSGFERYPIMFTDREETATEATANGWLPLIRRHNFESANGDPAIVVPMLNHKYWKCHPQELNKYVLDVHIDASIWIDGSIQPHYGFEKKAIAALGDDDWSMVPHPARSCIYPEGEYSATLYWRYDPDAMIRQINHYRAFHPPGWGLIATGVNIRRHKPIVFDLSHEWWNEILAWSHQDQLSLPVLMRIWEEKGFRWNRNLTWHQDWTLWPHG